METKSYQVEGRGFLAEAPSIYEPLRIMDYTAFLDVTPSVYMAKVIAAIAEQEVWKAVEANIYANRDAKGFFNGDSLQNASHSHVLAVLVSRALREDREHVQERGI